MPSNNANHNNQDADSRADQEDQVLWEYRTIFQDVHGQLLDQPEALTESENEYLESLYTDPTLHCFMAGIATVAVLKGTRGLWRLLRQGRASKNAPYDPSVGRSSSYQMDLPHPSMQPIQHQQQYVRKSFPRRLLTLANFVDVSLGSLVGIVTGAYWIDMHEADRELATLPLQSGKSNLCHFFCPPLVQEYQRQLERISNDNHNNNNNTSSWQQSNNNYNNYTLLNMGILKVQVQQDEETLSPQQHKEILENPQDQNLKAYLEFVQNCQRRKKIQDRIRRQQGLGEDDDVAIPFPGVEAHEEEEEEEDHFTSQAGNWVSDQEEQR